MKRKSPNVVSVGDTMKVPLLPYRYTGNEWPEVTKDWGRLVEVRVTSVSPWPPRYEL